MSELAERLGWRGDQRVLIVHADDLGLAQAANAGVYASLHDGVATSASLMVPAPWAREAAARYRGEDVGVHLTLNAEFDLYRWGAVTHAPSLRDGDGGFPRTREDLWDHADLEEVRFELRAQIERAIYWGFDVSHLDSHLGALQLRPEFFDVYIELAVEFGLPVRLPGQSAERAAGFPFRRLAADEGIVFPDHVAPLPSLAAGASWTDTLAGLEPGVTEWWSRPAVATDELRALAPDWADRADELDRLADPDLAECCRRADVALVGYRRLRALQREHRPVTA